MADEQKSPIRRWLLPLLIAFAALWLLSTLFGRKESPVDERLAPPADPAARTPALVPDAGTGAADTGLDGTGVATERPSAALYFATGSAILPADSTGGLEPVVAYLKAHPSTLVTVSGLVDSGGDHAVNETLARNRAEAVRVAIVGAGIDIARVELLEPAVSTGAGSTDVSRRVEVTVH